jgi:hypothetical protein
MSRFPAAFRPPAFASRSSDSRRGLPPSSRSAYRPEGRTPTGLPRSTRTSCDRGGCPLYPEDGGALPGLRDVLSRRLPLQAASPCTPLQHPTARGSASRGINESSSNSPVRSSPRLKPPDGTGAPWAFPRASHPADQGPDDARQGRGQAIEHGPETTLTTSAEPPTLRVYSMRATSRRTVPSGRLPQVG